MKYRNITRRAHLGTAMAALAIALGTATATVPTAAQAASVRPSETLNLSQGTGTLVRLSTPMTDVFIANDSVADIQVRSATQLYVFGKGRGETTIYATSKSGKVVYAANVRVGNNISSVSEMLQLAMPEASIQATPMNNLVLLTGTVAGCFVLHDIIRRVPLLRPCFGLKVARGPGGATAAPMAARSGRISTPCRRAPSTSRPATRCSTS